MSRVKKKCSPGTVCAVFGALLILSAAGMLLHLHLVQGDSAANAKKIVSEIRELLPQTSNTIPEERGNNLMPSMEIENLNFIGIIEIPQYETELPIYCKWEPDRLSSAPCRYTGSVYDRSLIIGGTGHKGQFDFAKEITVDDTVYITDMEGNRYSYIVFSVEHVNHAKTETLQSEEDDLTLFVKSMLSMEYIVIRCRISK